MEIKETLRLADIEESLARDTKTAMGIRKPTRVPPVPKEPLRRPLSSDLDLRWQPTDIMRSNPEVSTAYDKLGIKEMKWPQRPSMEDPLLGSAYDQQQAIELLELTHGSPQTANDGVHIRTEGSGRVLYGKDKFHAEWLESKAAFTALHKNQVYEPFEEAYRRHLFNRGMRIKSPQELRDEQEVRKWQTEQETDKFDYRQYGKAGEDDVGDIDLEESHAPEFGDIEMQEFREPLLQLNGSGGQTIRSTGNRTPLGADMRRELTETMGKGEIMVGTEGKLFVNFAEGLAKNAVAAAAMMALGYALPKEAGKYVNYAFDGWAIAELMTGNPLMAAMSGTVKLLQELSTQSARQKYNIESDRDHGKKFGYVRDGDKWYPAFVKQHEEWHGGLGGRGNDVDLVYGRGLVYRQLPGGKIEPELLHPIGTRHVSGSDADLLMSSKDVAEKDGLRDWYMLEPDDLSMVSKHGQSYVVPKAPMTTYKDDWSRYKVQGTSRKGRGLGQSALPVGEKYLPAWWASNLDLRRSLDYIKHWQIGSGMQHDTGVDPSLALKIHGTWYDKDGYQAWPGDQNYKLQDHWSGTKEWRTNKYVMDTLLKSQLVSLQQAQYSAAEEAQYGAETIETVRPPPNAIAPVSWQQPSTQPWRNYVDYAKDMPEAEGSDQLRDQLVQITKRTARRSRRRTWATRR